MSPAEAPRPAEDPSFALSLALARFEAACASTRSDRSQGIADARIEVVRAARAVSLPD